VGGMTIYKYGYGGSDDGEGGEDGKEQAVVAATLIAGS